MASQSSSGSGSSATPPRVLSIAGSDSGGGAGLQADLKTMSAFGVYGMTVVTATTAQNTLGVQRVEGVSVEMVSAQLRSVVQDIGVDAIKTGMLFSAETIQELVKTIVELYPNSVSRPPIVVDPVCVATSGHSLFPLDGIDTMKRQLFPLATVLTPNVPEAEFLAGWQPGSIKSLQDMRRCAEWLGQLGTRWIYLKGGHLPFSRPGGNKVVIDVLWDSRDRKQYLGERPFLEATNTHGTGCTLSSAIASELAKGSTGKLADPQGALA
jgi:hydroxymethylpyrimidine/phosphomethylpyrimidine kinase